MKRGLLINLAVWGAYSILQAQPTAVPHDFQSITWVINEVNRQISAKKGESRDFAALKNLFWAQCRFMVVNTEADAEEPGEMIGLDEFIEMMKDSYYEDGYYETSLAEIVEEYNGIGHAFQTFYGKDSEGEEARGINSIQLIFFQGRWWISSMLWTVESERAPIPEHYLSR